MTVFLVLVFGSLIAIVFAQLNGTRKAGELHASELRALQARVDALESGTTPAERGQAAAVAATAAAPASPAAPREPAAAEPSASPIERPAAETPLRTPPPLPLPQRTPPTVHVPEPTAPPLPLPERTAPPLPPRWQEKAAPAAPPVPGLGERIAAQLRSGWDQWVAQNLLAVAGGIFVLLGASFFVAVAISNGWLTPWRQVVAAVIGGALLLAAGWRAWPADASRRAAHILSQSLVGTGAGVMLLGVVAGARIYDEPLYPSFVGLIGAGAISALVVAIAVRWDAQITAALGITTAIAAPLLVDAPPTTGTIAFLLLALGGSAFAIAFRGWPWLLQVAIIASLPQPANWAINNRFAGDHQPAALAVAILVAWWALLALPALFFELRAASTRLRMPTSGALFQLAGLSVLFGRLAVRLGARRRVRGRCCACSPPCHLVAGAVMLRVRPSSRPGAVFVWAVGAALAAGAGAAILGGAAQPAFWAVETLAMLWLYVRFDDRQAGRHRGPARRADIRLVDPPRAAGRASPTRSPTFTTGVLALVAVVGDARSAPPSCCAARARSQSASPSPPGSRSSTWPACSSSVSRRRPPVRSTRARSCSSRARGPRSPRPGCLAAVALPSRFREGVRTVAELTLWVVAAKAFAIDSLALGIHEPRLLWLLAGLAGLAAVLVVAEERLPRRRRSRCRWRRRSAPCS